MSTLKGSRQKFSPKHPTMLDIAWAAGIYEGEGHCRCDHGAIRVIVVQKDPWLLHRLASKFGGTVGDYRQTRNVCCEWKIYGPRAKGFLMTIFSFLSPRRRGQIVAALEQHGESYAA